MKPNCRRKRLIFTVLAILLMLAGLGGAYCSLMLSFRPEVLQLKVFTFYSAFAENKYFTLITNNQADELSVLSYGFGWILLLFTHRRPARIYGAGAIGLFLLGYLCFHGLAAIYFIIVYLICLPTVFLAKPLARSDRKEN
jgi:hypothetical protein